MNNLDKREMTAGRWAKIEELFETALDLPAPERVAFLAEACAHDALLRREVEALLAAGEAADDFLCRPAAQPHSAGALPQRPAAIAANGANGDGFAPADEQVGPYRLIRELGRGGMGVVWLAERADGQFEQQVALKLITAGPDAEDIQQRFRHERQILAGLNHPNIARLTDGGATEDGRPFFVMEYVEGAPLDEYCRARRLGLNERLQLFLQVCAAAQYAHQHLVIHRDLKPGNILVTDDGAPKLLDFGIAKLLQPDLTQSHNTLPGARPMTPAYASPEQARGEKLTTASDVYSLGVVLYELLTGRSPYRPRENAFGELVKAICEQEPVKPSIAATQNHPSDDETKNSSIHNPQSTTRNLKGDLDSITLMALRKEPQARYSSVEQLAEDIRRYLAGLPTLARRGAFGYRALKYVRRNRIPLSAAALIALSLLGGIFATLRQARIALAAQHNAEAQQARAETQRHRAEAALLTAEERRQQADAARGEADQQRAEAEAQREQADEQRVFADSQRLRAEAQELSNRRLLYTSRMGLAKQAWDEANVERMRDLLNPYLPQPGAPDLRSFEWYYLWKLSHQEERTLPFPTQGPNDIVAFSADGKQLLTVTLRREGAQAPVATEALFRDVATGQAPQQLSLPPATITVLARDRNTLALARHGGNNVSVVALPDGKELRKITGLQGGLSSIDFTPDGKQLVAGFYDGSLGLLDLAAGREVYHFKAHQQRVFTVAVSPDGQQFISGGNDRVARLWALSSGKEIGALSKTIHLPQNSLFSPDGRLVVMSGGGLTTAWEAGSGKELTRLDHKGRRMVFTPDSRTLIIGGEDAERQTEITFLDTATWQETGVLRGHGNWILSLALTPDGQRLASGSLDRTVKLWNLNRANEAPFLNDPRTRGHFTQVVMTPDGKRLLIGDWKQSASVWDVATVKELMTLEGHAPPPNNLVGHAFPVAVSADGKWYATGGVDAQVKIWEAATEKEHKRFKAPASVTALGFAPRGNTLAVGCLNQLQLWDVGSGRVLGTLNGHQGIIKALSFAPDGTSLFTAGSEGTIRVWDVTTGQTSREYRCGDSAIGSFALARDGRLFATGGVDGAARLWDAQTGRELLALKGHSSPVSAVAFSPDGRRLATGGQDKIVKLWDLTTGEELIVLKGHRSWIADNSIGFSPEGSLLFSADWDRRVKFWRAATETEALARRP